MNKWIIRFIVIMLFLTWWFGMAMYNDSKRIHEAEYKEVFVEYDVRDSYRGYGGVKPFILVEYYDGDTIKTLDDRWCCNTILVRVSDSNEMKLVLRHVGVNKDFKRYVLYVSNESKLSGLDTTITRVSKTSRAYTTKLELVTQ